MFEVNGPAFVELHWILLATVCLVAIYHYIVRPWNYFSRHGVPFERGLPLFGTNYTRLFSGESLFDLQKRLYYKFPKDRFVGMYEVGGGAAYLIRDPELVSMIYTMTFDGISN